MTDQQSAIGLKRTRRWDVQFSMLAGFAFAICLPISVGGMAKGDCGALLILALPVILMLLGRCLQYSLAEQYVILHSDRVEFPRRRDEPRHVAWADVRGIQWPKTIEPDFPTVVTVPANPDWPIGRVHIDLQEVSPADRLTLIRYLRTATARFEQAGWPQFCQKRAIPLVEALRREEQTDAPGNRHSRPAAIRASISRFVDWRPFVAGAMCTLLFPLLLFRLVSRKTWWTLATTIGVSGVVNIRLIWGAWISPGGRSGEVRTGLVSFGGF